MAAVALARGIAQKSIAGRLHRASDRLDGQVRCPTEPLFAPVDVAAELAAPPLDIGIARDGDGWHPDEQGVVALRKCEVDVWLCFSAAAPRRPLGPISRLGVWGIEIGRGAPATSAWAGAMEVVTDSPVTVVSIVDYAASGDGLRYRSFGATVRNSARLNRLTCVRKRLTFFGRLLARVAGDPNAEPCMRPGTPAQPLRFPAAGKPTVSAVGRLSWRLVSNVPANARRRS